MYVYTRQRSSGSGQVAAVKWQLLAALKLRLSSGGDQVAALKLRRSSGGDQIALLKWLRYDGLRTSYTSFEFVYYETFNVKSKQCRCCSTYCCSKHVNPDGACNALSNVSKLTEIAKFDAFSFKTKACEIGWHLTNDSYDSSNTILS